MTTAGNRLSDAVDAASELEDALIMHHKFKVAVEALSAIQERGRRIKGGKKKRLKARCLLMIGKAGAGKSTLIEYYLDQNPKVQTQDGIRKPVVSVVMPTTPTKREMAKVIMLALGYEVDTRDNSYKIDDEIATKVELLGVEVIFLDEAHHMLQAKDVGDISEFLKSLANKCSCSFVLSGLSGIRQLATSSQLDRRLDPDLNLTPYNWRIMAERCEFLLILRKLEELYFNFSQPSNIDSEDFARRLYVATCGEIGLVTKYLSRAIYLATLRNYKKIDLVLMAEIERDWHPDLEDDEDIGFSDDIDMERIKDPGVLFIENQKKKIDRSNNPFACKASRLEAIFELRMSKPEMYVGKRAPRSRGSAPKNSDAL